MSMSDIDIRAISQPAETIDPTIRPIRAEWRFSWALGLLVPLAVARGWTFLGRESTAVPAALAAIFALSTVLGAAGSVGRVRSSRRGWLTAVAILACPAFVKYSSSQCADVPLSFFILATFVWMFRAVESPSDRSAWLLAGASAGLAAWTKNEE